MQITIQLRKEGIEWLAKLPGVSNELVTKTKRKMCEFVEEAIRFDDPDARVKLGTKDTLIILPSNVTPLLGKLLLSWTASKTATQIKKEMGWKSRSQYYAIIEGKHEPSLSTVCDLLAIFGKTLELNLVDLPYQKSTTASSKKQTIRGI